MGPFGPTDKENQVKMYKKYHFRYITPLKQWIRFRIEQSDPDPYQIENHDPDPYQSKIRIRIKRVWVRNTGHSNRWKSLTQYPVAKVAIGISIKNQVRFSDFPWFVR